MSTTKPFLGIGSTFTHPTKHVSKPIAGTEAITSEKI